MEIIPYRLYTVPLFCLLFLGHFVSGQLDYNFYDHSCPNLTGIVRNGVASAVAKETRMAASLCAYTSMIGCDASILLDESSAFKGEKNALPNRNSVRGFEVIDAIKADVERACPSTVSCADILTLAVREAIYLVGGPFWLVAMGRRDGLTANETAANEQLPSPIEPLENITAKFTSKGLTLKDVVVLSGAHTIGFAQCFTFKSRLFNFDNTGNPDPTLDASLLQSLQQICPNQADSNTNLAPLDSSDQALMGDNRTAPMVMLYNRLPYLFASAFKTSMVKMSYIGVLTGHDGEIRKNCRVVN
ncbi:Peroxidase 10 [Vitis vinifera]|uniref:Peroxidase n=1 Tax=Vitis vinifera TaxID=29760 RepID=A0A438FB19_VITVI|nr:Peroxidase 10 [Vitis vinifera]